MLNIRIVFNHWIKIICCDFLESRTHGPPSAGVPPLRCAARPFLWVYLSFVLSSITETHVLWLTWPVEKYLISSFPWYTFVLLLEFFGGVIIFLHFEALWSASLQRWSCRDSVTLAAVHSQAITLPLCLTYNGRLFFFSHHIDTRSSQLGAGFDRLF